MQHIKKVKMQVSVIDFCLLTMSLSRQVHYKIRLFQQSMGEIQTPGLHFKIENVLQ